MKDNHKTELEIVQKQRQEDMVKLDKARTELKERHSMYSRFIDDKEATHTSIVNDLKAKFTTLEAKHQTTTDDARNLDDALMMAKQTITELKAKIQNLELKLNIATRNESTKVVEKENKIKEIEVTLIDRQEKVTTLEQKVALKEKQHLQVTGELQKELSSAKKQITALHLKLKVCISSN